MFRFVSNKIRSSERERESPGFQRIRFSDMAIRAIMHPPAYSGFSGIVHLVVMHAGFMGQGVEGSSERAVSFD